MRLGILQPYCFAYLGYFQLINLADRVILLDTVQFSRPNWINRNRLANGYGPIHFAFPVHRSRTGAPIHSVRLCDPERHQARFLKTVQMLYGRAPFFERGRTTVRRAFDEAGPTLADLAISCVRAMTDALGISTPLHRAFGRYSAHPAGAENLVLDICRQENADVYVNPEGGEHLYSAEGFRAAGVDLEFLRHVDRPYSRGNQSFFARLSTLDALMFCSDQQLSDLLGSYAIVKPG